jgi:hypothetical protein
MFILLVVFCPPFPITEIRGIKETLLTTDRGPHHFKEKPMSAKKLISTSTAKLVRLFLPSILIGMPLAIGQTNHDHDAPALHSVHMGSVSLQKLSKRVIRKCRSFPLSYLSRDIHSRFAALNFGTLSANLTKLNGNTRNGSRSKFAERTAAESAITSGTPARLDRHLSLRSARYMA